MEAVRYLTVRLSRIKKNVILKLEYLRDFLSSLVFNFSYLPYNQAKYLPIWVRKVRFCKSSPYRGKIVIDTPNLHSRMIKLGVDCNFWYPDGGIKLDLCGTLIFKGECIIGNNSTIYVKKGCELVIGDNVRFTANNSIICECGITIGNNCRIGWNCQMMDTDFHYMRNIETGELTKTISKPIIIGNNNWFGNSCSIFKGFQTADYVTLGGGTKCRGRIEVPYTVWGNDGKLLKLREGWCRDFTNDIDYSQ